MSTNAAPALHLASSAPNLEVRDLGPHANDAFGEGRIRVIAGGRCGQVPSHARASLAASHPAPEQGESARLRASLQGVGFDLNARERAVALGAGALFAIVALIVALV